ncbi:MAG: hypothetical protein AB1609_20455 [Bacillota bacterium]
MNCLKCHQVFTWSARLVGPVRMANCLADGRWLGGWPEARRPSVLRAPADCPEGRHRRQGERLR